MLLDLFIWLALLYVSAGYGFYVLASIYVSIKTGVINPIHVGGFVGFLMGAIYLQIKIWLNELKHIRLINKIMWYICCCCIGMLIGWICKGVIDWKNEYNAYMQEQEEFWKQVWG